MMKCNVSKYSNGSKSVSNCSLNSPKIPLTIILATLIAKVEQLTYQAPLPLTHITIMVYAYSIKPMSSEELVNFCNSEPTLKYLSRGIELDPYDFKNVRRQYQPLIEEILATGLRLASGINLAEHKLYLEEAKRRLQVSILLDTGLDE